MSIQRTEAEALAACLELGLADVVDAVRWADGQILESDVPSNALCEVSMASHANNLDVAAMLRQLPGEIEPSFVLQRLIERTVERLRRNPEQARSIASALCRLALNETLPPGSLRQNVWWFYDAIDLAESRIIEETPAEIIQRMADTLDAELAALRGNLQAIAREGRSQTD
jgi:hypothetical protein